MGLISRPNNNDVTEVPKAELITEVWTSAIKRTPSILSRASAESQRTLVRERWCGMDGDIGIEMTYISADVKINVVTAANYGSLLPYEEQI